MHSPGNRVVLHASLIAAILGSTGCDFLSPDEEFQRANRAIDDWVAANASGVDYTKVSSQALALYPGAYRCSDDPPLGRVALQHAEDTFSVDLHFNCPVSSASTLEELRAAFAFAVVAGMPGRLESPNFRFEVYTPVSSFRDTVRFEAPSSGRLRVTISTPLFAVTGRSTRHSCLPPADAPAPDGCFVWREHRVPLRVTLDMPATLSALSSLP